MIRKISVRDLKPGMYVASMCSSIWNDSQTVYTEEGFVPDEGRIRFIIEAGYQEVFIDTSVAADSDAANGDHLGGETVPEGDQVDVIDQLRVPLPAELARARQVYAEAVEIAHHLFSSVAKGKPLDVAASRRAVTGIADSVTRNPDALRCLASLGDPDTYLYSHSVNVSVLCIAYAMFLEKDREDIMEVGLAGLFHDLGKTKLPRHLLNKAGKLGPEEFKLMESHSVMSLSILEEQEEVSPAIKRAVVEHHEKYDGTGYPFGLTHEQVSPFGRMLALADSFDALTSRRSYKEAMAPPRALSIMYGQRGKDFADRDVQSFIKCMGVFPSGSLVRLSDGRAAVVYETNPGRPLSPIVNVVLDRDLNPLPPEIMDLSLEDEGNGGVRIAEAMDPVENGVDMADLVREPGS